MALPDGELSVFESNERMRVFALEHAAEIIVSGGPRSKLERALVDLAHVTGSSDEDIKSAVKAATPKLKGLHP